MYYRLHNIILYAHAAYVILLLYYYFNTSRVASDDAINPVKRPAKCCFNRDNIVV